MHIRELTHAVAAGHALEQVVVVDETQLVHGEDQVDAGGVDGHDVGGGEDAHVGGHDGLGVHALAVTRDAHVAHDVHVGDVLAKEVDRGLGGLGDLLHELLVVNAPLTLTLARVNPLLADARVGAADADVLVGAAEAAHHVALEVREGDHRVVRKHVVAHAHVLEPVAACNGQKRGAVLVHDVDGAEVPAIGGDGLAVLFGGVAVTLIVGVGLDDAGLRQVLLHQLAHPLARDDVGAVGLAGVELDAGLAADVGVDLGVCLAKALGREVAGEVDDGLVAGALGVRDVAVAVGRCGVCHGDLLGYLNAGSASHYLTTRCCPDDESP